MPRPSRVLAALAVLALAMSTTTACRATSSPTSAATVTGTRTVTAAPRTIVPVRPDPVAAALTETAAQPPGSTLPAGESDGACPYITAGLNIAPPTGSEPDFADLEGSRVQRVTVLSTLDPPGCRFFWFDDQHATGDILPSTYADATTAHNTMVVTAEAGTDASGVPSFVPGVDGVSFRTHLVAADDGRDWAFVFAKGNVVVVVRTDQTDTSANARDIAAAIVGRF